MVTDRIELQWGDDLLVFDADSYEEIKTVYGFRVTTKASGYKQVRCTKGIYRDKMLCRFLIEAPAHLEVDHINGNGLDNRKCNLRLVTRVQNLHNTGVSNKKKSGLPKGVTYNRARNTFRASISVRGLNMNLGSFSTVEKAEAAYKEAAHKHFGEFASHLSRSN